MIADSAEGFSVTELLVATAIMGAVAGAIFGLVRQAQGISLAQTEASDMQQRLRVAIDVLTKDLLMAGAGLQSSITAPLLPYRIGEDNDPNLGIFYRPDTITVVHMPTVGAAVASHRYYVERDNASKVDRLMHFDGDRTDLPVVDHVVGLGFEYFETGTAPLDPAILQDGPWLPDETDARAFDADLLRIRRVRVRLRIQAALASMRGPSGILFTQAGTSTSTERYLPDQEIRFDVTPRNLNLDR